MRPARKSEFFRNRSRSGRSPRAVGPGGWVSGLLLVLLVPLLPACRQDMHDQPRLDPLEASSFFQDGRASRPRVVGTVARGAILDDDHLLTGRVDGELATTFPFEVTADVLARGRKQYSIYCTPCHDAAGTGQGMIVQRGLKQPTSFHVERLRAAPPGYFFDVVTNGFGAMYDYSDRVAPHDRWAIAAYVRALQLSQNASLEDVPAEQRTALLQEGGE